MSNEKCPVCGSRVAARCRCIRSEASCENHHTWHYCVAHGKPRLTMGPADHSKGLDECTCQGVMASANIIIHDEDDGYPD